MAEQNNKFKLFHKPAKGKMGGLIIVFLWIAVCNIAYQLLHGIWHDWSIQIVNWAFFASVTLFFMQEELSYKERFWHTLVGGSVGLLLAAGVIVSATWLGKSGVDPTAAVIIPLIVCIAALILLAPFIPVAFNNVGFIYFIVSFIQTEKVISDLPDHLLSLLLGSLILNLGCMFLLKAYVKKLTEKAKKAAAAAKE